MRTSASVDQTLGFVALVQDDQAIAVFASITLIRIAALPPAGSMSGKISSPEMPHSAASANTRHVRQ